MNYAYLIIPKGRRLAASLYFVEKGIVAEAHIWRKGIRDPDYTNWDHGVELGPESDPTEFTKLMMWGDMDAQQEEDCNNFSSEIPGAKIYWASDGWDRWSAMQEEDLKETQQPLEEWEL